MVRATLLDVGQTEIESIGVQVAVQTSWADAGDVAPAVANQFNASVGLQSQSGVPDGIILTMGHVSLPVLTGSKDEIQAQLRERGLKVLVQGRYFLTRERVRELIEVLTRVGAQFDELLEPDQKGHDQ
jgi:hypothetical protein